MGTTGPTEGTLRLKTRAFMHICRKDTKTLSNGEFIPRRPVPASLGFWKLPLSLTA